MLDMVLLWYDDDNDDDDDDDDGKNEDDIFFSFALSFFGFLIMWTDYIRAFILRSRSMKLNCDGCDIRRIHINVCYDVNDNE